MKPNFNHCEAGRLRFGPYASKPGDHFGAFVLSEKDSSRKTIIIVDDGLETGWEHVSVSVVEVYRGKPQNVMPGWELMCHVKDIFWDKDETVIQFHPKETEYVNNHLACLHLWKRVDQDHELPPSLLVGIKDIDFSNIQTRD